MKIIKTAKYMKISQTWSSPDAQDASIDMPESGVSGTELMSWVDEITTGGPYVGVYSALKEWLEDAGEVVDDKHYPRDPTEMENKTFALVQRIEQIAKKRGSMSFSQIKQDEHEARYEDHHEGLRKDRRMGLSSDKSQTKTAQHTQIDNRKVENPEGIENIEEALYEGWGTICDFCNKIYYSDSFKSFDPNMCNNCAEEEQMEQSAYRNERPFGSHDMHGDSDHRYAQNAMTDEIPNDFKTETDTKKLIGLLNELKELDLQFANEVKFRETNQHLYDHVSKKLSYIIGNLSYVIQNQIGK